MPFYTEPAKVDYEKLWAALDADFEKKLDAADNEPTNGDSQFANNGEFQKSTNARPQATPTDGTRRSVNGFLDLEKPAEPHTRALFGADFLPLKSPMPTFSTDNAWKQKVQIVRLLNKTDLGKNILKNPFLSYIFLRSTDNENYKNIIKKHPLWIKIFNNK